MDFSKIPELTVCLAVDSSQLNFLCATAPTWLKNRPELFRHPIVALIDGNSESVIRPVLDEIFPAGVNPFVLPDFQRGFYESQREFMLTSFVIHAPFLVVTPYWMKIDCDAVAYPHHNWIEADWFEDQPAYIASGWGYTKAKGGGGTIEEWCEKLESFGDEHWPDMPRLGLHQKIRDGKCRYSRMASWVSYYQTGWTRDMAALVDNNKLPVPSQDTFHWYCAERSGVRVQHAKQKRRGWSNSPNYDKVCSMAREAMQ